MNDQDGLDVGNIHRIVGIMMAFAFIGTGAYMHFESGQLEGMEDTQELLFRSIHIYLLLASLVNFALGIHYWVHPQKTFRTIQTIGSTLIGLAPVLFLLAFFNEPFFLELERPFSRPGIYAITLGLFLHMIAWYQARFQPATNPLPGDPSDQ